MPGLLHGLDNEPISIELGDDEIEVESFEEAYALAMSMIEDGESFTLHEAECGMPDVACSCVPVTYRKGARA